MNKIITIILSIFVFLLPLFFLPITTDFFDFNKQTLLVGTTILLFLLWIIKIIKEKRLTFYISPFHIPVMLLFLITTISTFFGSPYKLGSLLAPLGLVTLGGTTFLFILLSNIWGDLNDDKPVFLGLITSATILSLITLLWSNSIVTTLIKIDWLKSNTFNPGGSHYLAFLFLIITLSLLLAKIIGPFISKRTTVVDHKPAFFFSLIAGIIIILAVVSLSIRFIKSNPNLLPFKISLSIAFQTIKSFPSLLLGVGPGNYITAFSIRRPAELNQTPYWNLLFSSSSSYLLTLITETGLLSGILFLLLPIILIYQGTKISKLKSNPLFIPILLAFGLQILTLSSISIFITTFILLALATPKKKLLDIDLSNMTFYRWLFLLGPFLIGSVLFSIILGYLTYRVYLGEVIFKKSFDALKRNSGQEVYNLQSNALKINPLMDKYHVSFSQTNLALANSLSAKKNLSETDKQTIPRLIQQSINEARLAVALNKTSLTNWTNLASIYLALINFANGADNWAIISYQQAISLSPTDPQSRLSLGGVYYQQGKYQEAIKLFQEAERFKPDWANAHYNLAQAYKQIKDYDKAKSELDIVKALLQPNSPEAKKVNDEIESLNTTP